MSVRAGIWLAVVSVTASAGCLYRPPLLVGSGKIVGESYELANFDRLSVQNTFDVTVLQGEGFAVEVSADDNVMEYIRVVQHENELRIGLSEPLQLEAASLVVVVHLPVLTSASVSGASKLRLKSLEADRLELDISGASQLEGNVTADELVLNLSGAAHAKLSGQAKTLMASVHGASSARLSQLVVSDSSTVEATGASTAHVRTDGQLAMSASGASHVSYSGSPNVTRSSSSGASSIGRE
jgi:hypothetical protein